MDLRPGLASTCFGFALLVVVFTPASISLRHFPALPCASFALQPLAWQRGRNGSNRFASACIPQPDQAQQASQPQCSKFGAHHQPVAPLRFPAVAAARQPMQAKFLASWACAREPERRRQGTALPLQANPVQAPSVWRPLQLPDRPAATCSPLPVAIAAAITSWSGWATAALYGSKLRFFVWHGNSESERFGLRLLADIRTWAQWIVGFRRPGGAAMPQQWPAALALQAMATVRPGRPAFSPAWAQPLLPQRLHCLLLRQHRRQTALPAASGACLSQACRRTKLNCCPWLCGTHWRPAPPRNRPAACRRRHMNCLAVGKYRHQFAAAQSRPMADIAHIHMHERRTGRRIIANAANLRAQARHCADFSTKRRECKNPSLCHECAGFSRQRHLSACAASNWSLTSGTRQSH